MEEEILTFYYKNYKGDIAKRRVVNPLISFMHSVYHGKDKTWILNAFDLDKEELRDFCMKDILYFE